jgi:hypothetical protein
MKCPPLQNALKKILSRSLGAIPYEPGAGGTQNVEKPREQSVNIINYLCRSNEKTCHLLVTSFKKCYSIIEGAK